MKKKIFTLFMGLLTTVGIQAQLSSNPYKFFGNITTSYNVDAGGGVPQYYKLWNQITCENESKWSSVEGSRGNFNWGSDKAFNYAKQHNFTYKFHALVWGAQYPGWLENLSAGERFAALTNWFNHAKEHYETLPMIDVVNEAIGMHQQGNPMMKETLGGGGKTGYDWLIKAFEMAYERWPNAILIYNDYNSIRWDLDNYITLVRTLRDAGAPIDAYGNQAHELSDIPESELVSALKKQQENLQMPMFVTELDIDIANDASQKAQYQKVLPKLWEAPYCAGVTLWGYVYGNTWVSNSGLYKNGAERPAMTWIKEYMATEAAKTAVGPFPGAKKEASVYIRPAAMKVAKDDVLPIKVRAKMATKTIEKIDLYADETLIATMTEEPYIAEYTASSTGTKTLKAVVTTTDGSTYERLSRIQVSRGNKRKPYNNIVVELPGTIKTEEYDEGMSGVAYSNATRNTTTATKDGQWMEYTVDVKEEGLYTMEVEIASTKTGGLFHLAEYGFDNLTYYTNMIEVPKTGSTSDFQTLRCPMLQSLTAGRHVFCLNIDKGGFYIKSMTFKALPVVDIPGTLEIEDFASCSDGVNITSGNGGLVLANASKGQWLEYTVNVKQASNKYSTEAYVSSAVADSKFSMVLIDSDGKEKTLGSVTVPQTGSLDTYQVKTSKIRNALKEGKYTLRLSITNGGCNIDKVIFTCAESGTGIDDVTGEDESTGTTYNLSGQKVAPGYKGLVIRNGRVCIK